MNTTRTLDRQAASITSSPRVVLWTVQAVLSIFFLMDGFMMAFRLEILAQSMNWVSDVPAGLVRFIGISELLAAFGLIVPALTGIWPQVTAVAASGLAFIMTCACIFHIMRGEFLAIPLTLSLMILAAFVERKRWKMTPLQIRKGSWN